MQTTTAFAAAVAGEIRAELARRRLTQSSLAEFMNWNPSSLSRVLNNPDSLALSMLSQIAMYLGLSPQEIVSRASAA